jgi:hypothetical protein
MTENTSFTTLPIPPNKIIFGKGYSSMHLVAINWYFRKDQRFVHGVYQKIPFACNSISIHQSLVKVALKPNDEARYSMQVTGSD